MKEEINSYLFIGGSKDGEWIMVEGDIQHYSIPISTFNSSRMWTTEEPVYTEKISVELYHKYRLAQHARLPKPLIVYIHESIYSSIYTHEMFWDVMCKLVNNYKVVK